ncbi:MAG: hypothetical protein M3495_01570 [Pseudomonadota bacterium]|nr:hypothetical protein [Gammaproteobacteria bacterium]MDQ3580382.1 hypothetical protein [Pseudomonadota bacterium]
MRYLPLHPGTAELVTDYLEAAGHGGEMEGALFRPVTNNVGGTVEGAMTADGIYTMVKYYAKRVGVNIKGFGAHSLRATAVISRKIQGQATHLKYEVPFRQRIQ